MTTISIITPQNITLEYNLASVGDRIVAGIIDLAIMIAYITIVGIIISFTSFTGSTSQVIQILVYLPVSFYTLVSELLMNGQTVGKRVIHIKPISLNGNQPTFSQYLIMWLFRMIDVWSNFGLIAVVTIIISQRNQRLGDIVAGTTFIKTSAKTNFSQTIYVPVAENNYNPTYPEVINLKNNDIQLIKEVLLNIQKSHNQLLAFQAMQKVETILNIKSQHEPITFLYAVLSDYNHLSAKI